MSAWAGAKGTISMDKLSRALGMEGKGDFDGSMVADAWANGQHETIIEYCKDDVRKTRAIHGRFVAVNW
jgi:predicted PolB exonuclease-like 3'-5' exonuclease